MKRCSMCGNVKPVEDFARKNKGRPAARCKPCANEVARQRALTPDDQRRIRSRDKQTKQQNAERIARLKHGSRCADCGLTHPHWRMQFDHLPGSRKVRIVSEMAQRGNSWQTIEAEIAKCELVCANCHADRTHQRASAAGKRRALDLPDWRS